MLDKEAGVNLASSSSPAKYEVVSDERGAYDYMNTHFPLPSSTNQKGIVQKRNGEIIAASLFVDFNGSNVFMHCAGTPGTRWLTREFLHWSFHYPFVQLGCKRITLWVEATNAASLRFVKHLGFKREAILPKAGCGGVDVYIFAMFRNECQYA